MKLKEFIKQLTNLVENNPKAEYYIVISNEGDGFFGEIFYTPELGNFNEEDGTFNSNDKNKNSICIN